MSNTSAICSRTSSSPCYRCSLLVARATDLSKKNVNENVAASNGAVPKVFGATVRERPALVSDHVKEIANRDSPHQRKRNTKDKER